MRLKGALDASAAFHEQPHHARDAFRARVITFVIAAYYSDEQFLKSNVTSSAAISSGTITQARDRIDESGDGRV